MKKSELLFSALQVPLDYAMLVMAGLSAFFLRQNPEIVESYPLLYQFSLRQYGQGLLLVAAFFILVFAAEGLYNIRTTKRTLKEFYWVTRAVAVGLMVLIIAIFLNREFYSSRFVILAGAFFGVIYVSIGRSILRGIQSYYLIKKKVGIHRLLLIGVNGFCATIRKAVERKPDLGYVMVEHLDNIDLERIERIKKLKGIDEIINCDPKAEREKLLRLKEYCIRNQISLKYVPTLLQTANFNMQIFLGEPIIEIKNTPLDGWGKILKRVFDLIGAMIGIVIFSPFMLATAIAIWIESGRPIIYFNERVGHKGRFNLFKFRYMKKEYCHGAQFSQEHNEKAIEYLNKLIQEKSIRQGPIYKIKDDPRKTKVGTFIERFSLDEFPQFFNVISGKMSLVGPRPHQPIEVEKYEDYQRRVLTIKPGITGVAQVSGRSDLDFKDEVRLDTYYIENWSLWLDIQIILKTVIALLRKRRN